MQGQLHFVEVRVLMNAIKQGTDYNIQAGSAHAGS